MPSSTSPDLFDSPRLLILALVVFVGDPTAARAQELTLSVAISMKEAVEEIGRRFVQSRSGVRLHYNFGGSGELQKQIEAGAPVDIFVSAADRQMNELDRRGLIFPGSRRTFAHNALSVIVPADTRLTFTRAADLVQPQVQRIAIGNPTTVPAGQYAEESAHAGVGRCAPEVCPARMFARCWNTRAASGGGLCM
jgi:molybdate transport system substrate-binding protein